MIDSTSQTKIRRFQSTPSAWRETTPVNQFIRYQTFQSTPSAWRETTSESSESESPNISIHSLRMEGDRSRLLLDHVSGISIHSLRMEGDMHVFFDALFQCISIHSLRMEGDRSWRKNTSKHQLISIHSLRMEGDGLILDSGNAVGRFQSTPSAWRETIQFRQGIRHFRISIHSLRMEGDISDCSKSSTSIISIHSLRMEGD